jgi:hypothetical protein
MMTGQRRHRPSTWQSRLVSIEALAHMNATALAQRLQ